MPVQTFKKISFIALLTLTATTVSAQIKKEKAHQTPSVTPIDSTKKPQQVIVETHDGNTFRGTLAERRGDTVVIETASVGRILLPFKDIKSINEAQAVAVSAVKNDDIWFENPNASRYFVSSSGYGLRKGEGYYQNIYLYFNQVSYGISDNFSIGGGGIVAGTPLFYLTAKGSLPISEKFNLGIGAIGVLAVQGGTLGALFSNATLGSRDHNLSVGYGFGSLGSEITGSSSSNSSGFIMLGGQTRFARSWSFVLEAYLFPHTDALIIGGARFFTKGFNLDFGFFGLPIESSVFVPIPYLSIVVPFGHRKS